jgi:hypothetical protein
LGCHAASQPPPRAVKTNAGSGKLETAAGTSCKNVQGGKPSFLFRLNRKRAYAAANRAHGTGAETANNNNSTTTAMATATTAETRMKAVGGEHRNPPQVSRVADGRPANGMHGAAVATVNDDNSYDNDDGVASVRHQDPPQVAQFKNGGHEWEGGRTPRKKAQGG